MKKILFLILFLSLSFFSQNTFACDSCGCTLSKISDNVQNAAQKKRWFFDLTFEQQNWKVKNAAEAHTLHHQGHDFHDKTHEEFYHFTLGANLSEAVAVLAELPYVVRGSLDVEHHSTLGRKQQSEGIGDLNLIGIYKFLVQGDDFLGINAGVKLPTGQTKEKDTTGDIFEPELQPGSGSADYPLGIVYHKEIGAAALSDNVSYVIKIKGAHQFQYGDLFFASLNADYTMNPESKAFQTKIGLDMTFHNSKKDRVARERDDDSGETSFFAGPGLNVKANENFSVFGNILFPVYQNTGGVHQKLLNQWTGGVKIVW